MTDNQIPNSEPLPFESYPHPGHAPLGLVHGSNCRYGYGFDHLKLTGQTHCAYCGLDLVSEYENWLNMALDHVVPHGVCQRWNLPREWVEDHSNRVISCTTCNTFGNRYQPQGLERHTQERAFFKRVQAQMAGV